MPKIPAATAAPLVPGYRDFAPIARSESSEVYRAYQEGVDRPVAIKVLLLDDEEAVLRFEREVDITVQLGRQHPNIVTVLDVRTTSSGRPCIVMEYYDRGSLHDRLRERGSLPAGEVQAAGIAVADALAFAHVHGVLHRDIKPQNVLVLPTTYVLADFGIARRVDAGHTSSVEWFSFRHAAPQVLDGEPPAVEDDIWSVGSTLFTLLDGSAPFAPPGSEDSALAYMRRVRQGAVRTLRRADVPPRLADIVMRCLRTDRADRFPDAAALQDALAALTADTRGWAPPPEPVAAASAGPGAVAESTAARSGPMSPNTMARVVASAVSAGGHQAPPVPAEDSAVEEPSRESGRLRRFLPRIVVALVIGGLVGVAGTFVIASANRAGQAGSPAPSSVASVGSSPGTSSGALPGSGGSGPGSGVSAGPSGPDVNDPRIAPVITQLEARGAEGVFLRWQDRSGGAAAFIVVQVGRRGDPLKTLSPGVTQAAIGGLDPATAPYCFHVIALVGADQRGVSAQRCLGAPSPPQDPPAFPQDPARIRDPAQISGQDPSIKPDPSQSRRDLSQRRRDLSQSRRDLSQSLRYLLASIEAPGCAQPSSVYRDARPWPQRLLSPERVWPLTTGSGVTVAVIGTGVDAGNGQFRPDQVGAGTDVSGSGRRADEDCDGRGTFAAGLIAAQPAEETAFAGIAPGVRILPVRYAEATDRGRDEGDPDRLAAAIRTATAARADVICVVLPTTTDSPALDRAVAEARAADIVVVSAAVAAQGSQSYPTADPSVIAVGAVTADGAAAGTETGDHIDVAAPGRDLVSLGAGAGGRLGHIGPVPDAVAYSAAFVAGTAALVRAYRPDLDAAAVAARIVRTAGGSTDPHLGHGIVNLYAAVTAEGVEGAAPKTSQGPIVIGPPAPASKPNANGAALVVAIAALVLAATVAVGAAAVRRGRSRFTPPGAEPPRR